jgi:hypothetical protein
LIDLSERTDKYRNTSKYTNLLREKEITRIQFNFGSKKDKPTRAQSQVTEESI